MGAKFLMNGPISDFNLVGFIENTLKAKVNRKNFDKLPAIY